MGHATPVFLGAVQAIVAALLTAGLIAAVRFAVVLHDTVREVRELTLDVAELRAQHRLDGPHQRHRHHRAS